MARSPIPKRLSFPLTRIWGISSCFQLLSPSSGQVATCYSPVRRFPPPKWLLPRLACVRHAASVHPEPGSNSPYSSEFHACLILATCLSVSTILLVSCSQRQNRSKLVAPQLVETFISTAAQVVKRFVSFSSKPECRELPETLTAERVARVSYGDVGPAGYAVTIPLATFRCVSLVKCSQRFVALTLTIYPTSLPPRKTVFSQFIPNYTPCSNYSGVSWHFQML